MTNIAKDFEHFFKREHRSIATITADNGSGNYQADIQGGSALILKGTGVSVGDKVFYDVKTRQIIEKAPNVTWLDVPVE